jgi:Asp-tRNA(Asn)/Glu-tRNA(Gln) amidotransferase C subunit
MTKSLSMQELENLFRLSNFELPQEQAAQWHSEIALWLEFFSLSAAPAHADAYTFVGLTPVQHLRPDSPSHTSLTSAQIKLYCKQFMDGFVALPEHKRDL